MLTDADDYRLQLRAGGIRCPRCGRLIVVLVGNLNPREICLRESTHEREARRKQVAMPHACEACEANRRPATLP